MSDFLAKLQQMDDNINSISSYFEKRDLTDLSVNIFQMKRIYTCREWTHILDLIQQKINLDTRKDEIETLKKSLGFLREIGDTDTFFEQNDLVVEFLESIDDSPFYRIHLNFHCSFSINLHLDF